MVYTSEVSMLKFMINYYKVMIYFHPMKIPRGKIVVMREEKCGKLSRFLDVKSKR